MEITSIIVKPRITEKTQAMRGERSPKMAFLVHRKANKNQIKVAFEALFGIKAKSVNTLNRKPAPARFMNKSRYNFHKAFKVAFITVGSKDFEDLSSKLMEEVEVEAKEEKVEEKEDGN